MTNHMHGHLLAEFQHHVSVVAITEVLPHASVGLETSVVFASLVDAAFHTVPIIAMVIWNPDSIWALDEGLTVIASEMLNGFAVVL